MTDKPTPTDAELKAMWQLHAADIGGIFDFARAALEKWGQPAQKTVTVVPATGDVWLKHDDDLRYVRRVLEAGRQMTDVDQRAAIDIVQGLRVTARSMAVDAKKPAQAAEPVAWAYASMGDWGYKTSEKVLKITRHAQPQHGFVTPLYLAPQPVAREPLTDGRIEDLLICGNPTDEEMRLIRTGWDAEHGIKGGQHGTE